MPADQRAQVYQELHQEFLPQQDAHNRASAAVILRILFQYTQPRSVLDVGCGLGTWLAVPRELGVEIIQGVEGNWLDPSSLQVPPAQVTFGDLEHGLSLGRKFDLVICLEVAEHLSAAAAERFIASLTEHGDIVLFSAAIPYQGGYHHVNEQFPDYWARLFLRHGYCPLDCIRPHIWDDPAVLWWLRQNTLLFVHPRALESSEALRREAAIRRPLAVVHPIVYRSRLEDAGRLLEEHRQLIQLLSKGGTFQTTLLADGRLTITKL
jgi:SAM-dependent methyltransferase